MAHALWNWGDNGRKKLPIDHVSRTKTLLVALLHNTASLLLLPTLTRGRHRFTAPGRKLAARYADKTEQLQLQVVSIFRRLHQQVEVMKACGLPANEASRINQYHWLLQARIERLLNIKVRSAGASLLTDVSNRLLHECLANSSTGRLRPRVRLPGCSS